MSNVLLIYDNKNATLTVDQALSRLDIDPVHLVLDDFDAEYLLAEIFDLIIFELFGETSSCVTILQQLEKLTTTSGIDHPPVIVVAEQSPGIAEQALRTAKVSFFLIRPLDTAELIAAITQSLPRPTKP